MRINFTDDSLHTNLKKLLGEKRYNHSVNVMNTARNLAKYWEEDEYKAKVAGLFHDIGKNINYNDAKNLLYKHGMHIDSMDYGSFHLLHGLIGRFMLIDIFGILDEDILDSVENHIMLRKDASNLEKIIYLADMIEPTRDYPGVDHIRYFAYKDLDKAVLMSINSTIIKLVETDRYIGNTTIEARNDILQKNLKKED